LLFFGKRVLLKKLLVNVGEITSYKTLDSLSSSFLFIFINNRLCQYNIYGHFKLEIAYNYNSKQLLLTLCNGSLKMFLSCKSFRLNVTRKFIFRVLHSELELEILSRFSSQDEFSRVVLNYISTVRDVIYGRPLGISSIWLGHFYL